MLALRALRLTSRPALRCRAMASMVPEVRALLWTSRGEATLAFGPVTIRRSEVFAASPESFAFVNLRPLVPGHVLVSPRRVCPRFSALSADEVSDLWLLAQQVAAFVEHDFKADSMSLVIQDGPAAGQSIPHVHIHVLPRRFFDTGDLEHNDEVYDMINAASKREAAARQDLDQTAVVKTREEMAAEALRLRQGMAVWRAGQTARL